MANKVYDSAGVYMSEKDLTFSTEVVGVTTLGLVGETLKGPAMQPIFIQNYDDFKVMFGGTNPTKYKNTQIPKYELPYISKAYLSQTNQLYVTRVLGVSGYNSGLAYVLRTIGNVDQSSLSCVTVLTNTIPFYLDGSTFKAISDDSTLLSTVATLTNVVSTDFDTTFNTYFATGATAPWNGTVGGDANGIYWGVLTSEAGVAFSGVTSGGTRYDAYELPSDVTSTYRDEHWYTTKFELGTGDTYTGYAFALYVDPATIGLSGSTTTGTTTVYTIVCTGDPQEEYHNKVIATLRSRGLYVGSTFYEYATSTIALTNTDDVVDDPYLDFNITGTTTLSGTTSYNYTVNLDKTSSNYIKNVLGTTPQDKDSYLYVEECYPYVLDNGYNRRFIKGINANIEVVNTWNHYLTQFQAPITPYFVSELRGGLPQRLFRLVSISDGNSANSEIKISISNVDLADKTFNLYVRKFSDVDRNPAIIERFLNCSMDPQSDDFIGRKIGTADNMYDLRSSYVMVELDEYAPTDAVPSGFEGMPYRVSTNTGVPYVTFKTKYYNAGETIYTPPYSAPITSSGDKVKKVYLGFSDTVGIDTDLIQFKGVNDPTLTYNNTTEWGGRTKGFHLDVNAASVVNVSGDTVFEVGAGQFTDPVALATDSTQTYYDIRTRKFTTCFYGGFDGWDVYRDYRTNGDSYKIGRTNFVEGTTEGIFSEFDIEGKDDSYGSSDYYAYLIALQTFENPEETNINILGTPGVDVLNNTDLIRDAVDMVEEQRQDCVYLPTLPDIDLVGNNYPANTDDWYYPRDIVEELEGTEIDTNYGAVYYPWYQLFDSENNTNIFIPPTTDVVRNLALTDNIAHPWYASAGYKRGLVNSKRTRIKLTQDMRDDLYNGRINPLATFSDIGVAIWGNKNLQVANSALNRLNIRRLLLQCKKLIGNVGNRLLFDPNDDTIRNDFLAAVNPILDNIRKERGLIDFRVKLLPLADESDRNTLRGKIFLKPTSALEFIELEFTVTPTNVSFDNF